MTRVTLLREPANAVGVTVASVSKDAVSDAGGASLVITGTGFQPGHAVVVGGASATVTNVTATDITVTVPAYSGGASNDGSLVSVSVEGVVLADCLTYFPAPTATEVSHDFEDGTLGSWVKFEDGSSTVAVSAEQAYTGTKSVKCTVAADPAPDDTHYAYISSPSATRQTHPDADATGVYLRFAIYVPAATATNVQAGQIKFIVWRDDGATPYWANVGIGAEFSSDSAGLLVGQSDSWGDPAVRAEPAVDTSDTWTLVHFRFKRSGGQGRVQLYVNNRSVWDTTTSRAGHDDTADPTNKYYLHVGIAHTQNRTDPTEAVIVYVDDPSVANGWID